MTPREAMARAMREGHEAGTAGRPVTDCPFNVRSTDRRTKVLATLWLRAYHRARPGPVDYRDRETP